MSPALWTGKELFVRLYGRAGHELWLDQSDPLLPALSTSGPAVQRFPALLTFAQLSFEHNLGEARLLDAWVQLGASLAHERAARVQGGEASGPKRASKEAEARVEADPELVHDREWRRLDKDPTRSTSWRMWRMSGLLLAHDAHEGFGEALGRLASRCGLGEDGALLAALREDADRAADLIAASGSLLALLQRPWPGEPWLRASLSQDPQTSTPKDQPRSHPPLRRLQLLLMRLTGGRGWWDVEPESSDKARVFARVQQALFERSPLASVQGWETLLAALLLRHDLTPPGTGELGLDHDDPIPADGRLPPERLVLRSVPLVELFLWLGGLNPVQSLHTWGEGLDQVCSVLARCVTQLSAAASGTVALPTFAPFLPRSEEPDPYHRVRVGPPPGAPVVEELERLRLALRFTLFPLPKESLWDNFVARVAPSVLWWPDLMKRLLPWLEQGAADTPPLPQEPPLSPSPWAQVRAPLQIQSPGWLGAVEGGPEESGDNPRRSMVLGRGEPWTLQALYLHTVAVLVEPDPESDPPRWKDLGPAGPGPSGTELQELSARWREIKPTGTDLPRALRCALLANEQLFLSNEDVPATLRSRWVTALRAQLLEFYAAQLRSPGVLVRARRREHWMRYKLPALPGMLPEGDSADEGGEE